MPCLLEMKDCQCIDMEFPLVFAVWNNPTGYAKDAKLAKVSRFYYEPVVEIYRR